MNFSKTTLMLAMAAASIATSAWANDDNGSNFGGPDAVDNQIAEDNKKSKPNFKSQLEQNNVSMGVDYSTVFLGATNVLPDSDDSAAGGMLRFYGSWNPIGIGTKETGGLVWKVEHRHSYTDTSVKDFEFGTGGLGLVTPPFSDEGFRITWKKLESDEFFRIDTDKQQIQINRDYREYALSETVKLLMAILLRHDINNAAKPSRQRELQGLNRLLIASFIEHK